MSAALAFLATAFNPIVDWTIQAEGGSVLHTDTGGLTRYGISKKANPDVDIKNLTREQAKALYHQRYWVPIEGDKLPAPLAFVLFDTAVNLGVTRAVRLLQAVVHTKQDGVMGPKTRCAVEDFQLRELVTLYLNKRRGYYQQLAQSRPVFQECENGWQMRVVRLALAAGRMLL